MKNHGHIAEGRLLAENMQKCSRKHWLFGSQTLATLRRKRRSTPLPRYFRANTSDTLYVADNNAITVWARGTAQLTRTHVMSWTAASTMPEYATLGFSLDLFVPEEVATFHGRIETLLMLFRECGCFYFDLADHVLGCVGRELKEIKDSLLDDDIRVAHGASYRWR